MNPLLYVKYFASFAVVVAISYALYSWHYRPLKDLEKTNASCQVERTAQETTIKNLGTRITQLIEENRVVGFEEYFKGLEDANNTEVDDSKFIF